MLTTTTSFAALLALLAWSAPSAAEPPLPVTSDADVPSIALHGMVSQGFMWSSDNNYLTRSSKGSVELSAVALNVTAQITHELRVGMQLFARDLGPLGNYAAKFDWYYLDYRLTDWLGLRAGRLKVPFGLYNEFADIDAAYLPVLLPQSVYPTTNRDFLLAQTGAEAYGFIDLCDGGALEYRVYGGTIFLDRPEPVPGSPIAVAGIDVPYVFGARLMWETPLDGLRLGGTVQSLEIDTHDVISGATPIALDLTFPVTIWLASIEYAPGDLTLAAEYSRWHGELTSNIPAIFPGVKVTNERYYVMVADRFAKWLQVGAYYSAFYLDKDRRHGRANYQHDAALTVRFDIGDHWLVKVEGHYMRGTGQLDPDLNGGTPLSQLKADWGVLMLQTSAFF
ncbi:MAG: hypothetical protein U1F43_36675 [Myxococcota bacterium]